MTITLYMNCRSWAVFICRAWNSAFTWKNTWARHGQGISNEIELRTDISQHTRHIIRNALKSASKKDNRVFKYFAAMNSFKRNKMNILKCHSMPNYFLLCVHNSVSHFRLMCLAGWTAFDAAVPKNQHTVEMIENPNKQ